MARRKKKNKTKNSKKAPVVPVSERSEAELTQELQQYIEQKRDRRAWGLCKEILKTTPEPSILPLIAQALQLRISKMLDASQTKEAASMFSYVLSKQPFLAPFITVQSKLEMEVKGCPLDMLKDNSGAFDKDVQELLPQLITDPFALAESSNFPEQHRIKADAKKIVNAWQTIEAGNPLPALTDISRRSPLIHWRLFMQALAAFYENDDATAEQNLKRIPETVPVRGLADALLRRINHQDAKTAAEKKIAQCLSGESLKGKITAIDDNIENASLANGLRDLEKLCKTLISQNKKIIVRHLTYLLVFKRPDLADQIIALSPYVYNQFEKTLFTSAVNVSSEEWEKVEDIIPFHEFSSIETAVLFQKAAKTYMQPDDPFRANYLELEAAVDLLDKSISEYPLASAYDLKFSIYDFLDDEDEKISTSKEWYREFPNDPKALARIAATYAESRNYVQALHYFEEYAKICGESDVVKSFRPFYIAQAAYNLFSDNNKNEGKELLDQMGNSYIESLLKAVLLWNFEKKRKEKVNKGKQLEALQAPAFLLYIMKQLDPKFTFNRLPNCVQLQFTKRKLLLESFIKSMSITFPQHWEQPSEIMSEKLGSFTDQYFASQEEVLDYAKRIVQAVPPQDADDAHTKIVFNLSKIILKKRKGAYTAPALALRAYTGMVCLLKKNPKEAHPFPINRITAAFKIAEKQKKTDLQYIADIRDIVIRAQPDCKKEIISLSAKEANKILKEEKDAYSAQRVTSENLRYCGMPMGNPFRMPPKETLEDLEEIGKLFEEAERVHGKEAIDHLKEEMLNAMMQGMFEPLPEDE